MNTHVNAANGAQAVSMQYGIELHTRFGLVASEMRVAKAFVGKRGAEPKRAIEYVERAIAEAEKLKLHLQAWEHYRPTTQPTPSAKERRTGTQAGE